MNAWEIRSGSARISLSYHEKSGVINGDAVLCKLPVNNRDRILQYLLIENQSLKNLSFSVQDDTVILTLTMNDFSLNEDEGMEKLRELFSKADTFDNILVEQFNASWPDVVR